MSELRDQVAAILPTLRGNSLCRHPEDAGCEDLGPEHHWEYRHADAIMPPVDAAMERVRQERDTAERAVAQARHLAARLRSWYHDPEATVAQAGAIVRDLENALSQPRLGGGDDGH